MDFLFLGKKVLFTSFALLTGLFITQAIIEAHSPDPKDDLDYVYREPVEAGMAGNTINERIRENFREWAGETDDQMFPIDSDIIQQRLVNQYKKGEPFAYVADGSLYVINHRGSILAPADSMKHFDLPVITGDSIKVYGSTLRVGGEDVQEALQLIKFVKSHYKTVYSNLSEVHINEKIGLIVYSNVSKGLPMVFGRGDVENKGMCLYSFIKELGQSKLALKAKYLDFRLKGQIILKKHV